MDDVMLSVSNLHVEVSGVEILHGIDLTIRYGETAALFGPNGSGKSTLLMTLMGFPKHIVTGGNIVFKARTADNHYLLKLDPTYESDLRALMSTEQARRELDAEDVRIRHGQRA